MDTDRPRLLGVVLKSAVVHTVTYFLAGLLALALFDYAAFYADPQVSVYMRQTNAPLVMAGPLFQPIRGILFGLVFYLLRDSLFGKKNGWLVMWVLLVVVGILSTFGPSPGSIEGVIYTVWPLRFHLRGLPEVLLQSLVLSVVLTYWVNHPEKRWLSWVLGILFVVLMLMPILGFLAS